LLALLVDGALAWVERHVAPAHLRRRKITHSGSASTAVGRSS
jgi:hypothetical protein